MHCCLFFLFFLWRCIGVIRGTWSIDLLRKNALQILFFSFFHLDFSSNVSTVKVTLHLMVHIYQKLAGLLTHTHTHTHTPFTFLSANCSEWGMGDGEGGRGQEEAERRGCYAIGSVDALFSAFLQWLAETASSRCCIVLSDMSTAHAHLPQNSHVRSFLCSLEGWVVPAYLDVKLRTWYAKCVQVGRSEFLILILFLFM